MRPLRVVVTAALVTLAAVTWVLAQDPPDQPQRQPRGERAVGRAMGMPMQILDRLQELDLTDKQRDEIDKLRADFEKRMREMQEKLRPKMEEMRKFREANPDDREGLRKLREEMQNLMTPMREAMQAFIEEVKGVLNEEQLKKFEEMMAQRGGGAGGPDGPGGQREQGMQLPGVPPQVIEQLQLTGEQKEKLRGIVQAHMEEMRQLREKLQGQIKEILTPDQAAKFEKLVTELRQRFQDRMGGRRGEGGDAPPRRGNAGEEPPPPPPAQ